MRARTLHALVRKGDLQGLRELLASVSADGTVDVNAPDRHGVTPLMHAVADPAADVGLVRLLLDHGARIVLDRPPSDGSRPTVLARALACGDPRKVEALLSAGADLHYQDENGCDALLDAVHGRDMYRDPHLIDLLNFLISQGVALSGVSSYHESALRVLSGIGRFDAVQVLLKAGADASQLNWTPLIQAVALGSLQEVDRRIQDGARLEEADWWSRTAWLVALQTGDTSKAKLLRERGAATSARGRCGKPPLFYAIETHHPLMLRWLLDMGLDIEQTDDFGSTALMEAVERNDVDSLNILLETGADVHRKRDERTALHQARSSAIARRLLNAGADPSDLAYEGQRALLGYPADPQEWLLDVSREEFLQGQAPRFGSANPEWIREPFWESMIRAGVTGYTATELFAGPSSRKHGPVWCAQRFGQSITFLPDGRIVQVGGEHEDSYDADFCIYNDVFVHEADGMVRTFGYPESVFPPTDFHTATRIANHIYLIGSLGYSGSRCHGKTPVYRLNTDTFRIEPLEVSGEPPGWIHRHRATTPSSHEIRVEGGLIATAVGETEELIPNDRSFILDVHGLAWRAEPTQTLGSQGK